MHSLSQSARLKSNRALSARLLCCHIFFFSFHFISFHFISLTKKSENNNKRSLLSSSSLLLSARRRSARTELNKTPRRQLCHNLTSLWCRIDIKPFCCNLDIALARALRSFRCLATGEYAACAFNCANREQEKIVALHVVDAGTSHLTECSTKQENGNKKNNNKTTRS